MAAAAEAARAAAAEAERPAAEEAAVAAQAAVARVEEQTSGIGRVDWKLETMHGKNVCDPLSNMPARTLGLGQEGETHEGNNI